MEYKHNKELVELAKELRKNMTKQERRLWYDFLKEYPAKVLRQKIIGSYIVDFYCAEAKSVIELDGSQHYDEEQMEYDAQRTAFLSNYGIRVLRIPNNKINENFNGVCEYLDEELRKEIEKHKA